MSKIVTILASSDSGWVKVFINGNEVISGPGSIPIQLSNGVHYLTYFVQGLPGNNYQIAIVDPPEETWEVKGVLKDTHTTGQYGVTI